MRRITLLTALLALAVAPVANAKMTTVKGAKCTACHEGTPKDKKFNPATVKMLASLQGSPVQGMPRLRRWQADCYQEVPLVPV